jgi:hypothetical protein
MTCVAYWQSSCMFHLLPLDASVPLVKQLNPQTVSELCQLSSLQALFGMYCWDIKLEQLT